MKNNFKETTKGFTIVETLVAIAILMIAIAGPLTIAQKGLMASIYARDQSVATFLAQDAMEYVKNYRDLVHDENNPEGWLGILSSCSESVPCEISTTGAGSINTGISPKLYRTTSGFTHSGDAQSQFTRTFHIEEIQPDIEVKAVVTVSWTTGTVQNVVTIEDYLFNIQL